MKPDPADLDRLPEELRWELVARHLAGETGPEDAARVTAWLDADPARRRMVETLDRAAGRTAATPAGLDVEAALRKVKHRFAEAQVVELPSRGTRWPGALRIAAVLALVASGTLLWEAVRSRSRVEPAAARTYATPAGRADSVPLPDGSRMILAPGSEATVAAGYGAGSREISLRGEALFRVTHDAARPFTVRAGVALVRDLGTVFTVRSDEDGVRVVVLEGSVELQDSAHAAPRGAVLRAGDVAQLGRQKPVEVRRGGRTEGDVAWTRGHLVFENASLGRVRDDLRRWFGLELVVADSSLGSRHVNATFAGESKEQVLDAIALSLGARLERRGDTVIVRTRGAATRP